MTELEVLRGGNIKVGDTRPELRLKLLEDNSPFNLSGHTVNLVIKIAEGDSPLLNTQATIESPERGIVTYDWSSGETDDAGTYRIEVVASDGAGEITFPNDKTGTLYIQERLA